MFLQHFQFLDHKVKWNKIKTFFVAGHFNLYFRARMVLGDKSCENSGVYGCSVCATCRFCSSLKNKRCSACIYAQHGVFPKTIECIVHAIQSRNMWVTDAYSCKSTSGKHYKKKFRKIIIKLLKYFHFFGLSL